MISCPDLTRCPVLMRHLAGVKGRQPVDPVVGTQFDKITTRHEYWEVLSPPSVRRVPPCAVKTRAVRPVFAQVVRELRAADPSNVQGFVKQNASSSPGEQSEAPRPRWRLGQEQSPKPENQDSQHMLEQPRGSFPDLCT